MKLLSILALATSTVALSATQQVSVQTARSATDWNLSVAVQKFNPALGTLNSVKITFGCAVDGTLRGENRSANTSTLVGNLSASCSTPGLNLNVLPSVTFSFSASPSDGVTDYAGTSGFTATGLSDSKSASTSPLSDSPTLNNFSGAGTVTIPISAVATSSISGSGNISSDNETFAQGFITVEYDYVPTAPVPSSVPTLSEWGMITLAGLLGLFGVRQSLSAQN